jgi:hypothetical protein
MAKLRRSKLLISTQRSSISVTSKQTIVAQVRELFPVWKASVGQAAVMDRWYYNELIAADMPEMPEKTPQDLQSLQAASPTAWAKMIADSLSQDLIVDGVRQRDNGDDAPAYSLWQQNSMDGRQKALHDGVVRHGKAFNLVGRAVGRLDGKRTAFIRSKSALTFDAFYRDDFDEWPEFAIDANLQHNTDGSRVWRIDFYDEDAWHRLSCPDNDLSKMEYIDYEPHQMNVCPVVRFAPNLDLVGRSMGEIEPYITLFKRINQSTFDRLVVQRHGAFVIRWLAGIEAPATEAEKRAAALALSMTDLLMIPSEHGKAGSLPATPLDGYIRSRESDIRDLSGVSQTPSFHMLGLSDNVGADGLAAAEASHMRKADVWKISLGESHEASMRLGGYAAGNSDIAADFQSRVHWRDTTKQSFQSLAQGLGTLASQLGIPGEALWDRIPGWEQPDTERARQLQEEVRAQQQLEADLAAQQQADAAQQQGAVSSGNGAQSG